MTKTTNIVKTIGLGFASAAVLLAGGVLTAQAQRDPFQKPGYKITRTPGPASTGSPRQTSAGPVVPGVPSIEQRIEYFKRLREQAAASGMPLPKVTSVLTLDEMAVTGIFRTPRGYAAMVEATPIKLSYTIYPGEKFFDGQLVAVEENRLVFRKVTKAEKGKFVSSVENKPLRQYSMRAEVEGTAPIEGQRPAESAPAAPPVQTANSDTKTAAPATIVSPLEEMNKQAPAETKDTKKEAKSGKKPVKVARNKK